MRIKLNNTNNATTTTISKDVVELSKDVVELPKDVVVTKRTNKKNRVMWIISLVTLSLGLSLWTFIFFINWIYYNL